MKTAAIDTASPGTAGKAVFGTPVLRKEDKRFLMGNGQFVDDIKLPGLTHAAILRSSVAHGRILSIDVSAALESPGVLTVITAADIKDVATLIPIPPGAPLLPGFERFLQYPLAVEMVRYVGEAIAVVVAENRYLAEDALGLIFVDIEELDAVTNIDNALTDEVLVNEAAGTNLASHYSVSRGDPDAAFIAPFYTRKEVFRCHRHTGMPLETRGFISRWDTETETLTCWGASKQAHITRNTLADMLKLDRDRVTLVENDVGGNFGVRGHFYAEDFLIAFLAMKLHRPVKYIEDRREHFFSTHHSREGGCELEIAVNEDGTIAGMRGRVFTDLGAYAANPGASVVPAKTVQFIPGPYDIANFGCELSVLVTNKTPIGPYRGPGRYEASFYCERMLDIAAADLGLDPVEFRLRNLIGSEQMPYKGGLLVPFMGESDYDNGDYRRTLDEALRIMNYDTLKNSAGKLIDGKYHGIAISCYVDSTGVGPSEEARIVVKSPTHIEVYTGSSSAGQGIETVMSQVAAEQLGIPFDWVSAFQGSTTYVKEGHGFGHSRCAVMGGSAVFMAANKLIQQILDAAALRYNESRDGLDYRDGGIYRTGGEECLATFSQFVQTAGTELDHLQWREATETFRSNRLTYSYGASAVHLTVDPETAVIDVVRYLTVEDCGRTINPMIVHGQAIGASVQGLSGTMLDEFVYDDAGQILTGSFADYLVATSTEFPNVEALTLEEVRSDYNPLGIKGAAESPISATGAVIANAVSNALSSLGVQVHDLPLSPNNLSRLIRQARTGTPNHPETGTEARFGISYAL